MVRALMKPGQYCAVKYSNTYHRAIVLRNISENIIQVISIYATGILHIVFLIECYKIMFFRRYDMSIMAQSKKYLLMM